MECTRIVELSRLSPIRGLWAIVVDWLIIVACFSAAIIIQHWTIWFAAGCIIATRQHALLVIMHDAAHYRLLPNRAWNDRLSDWLLAWPLLVSTKDYRASHLAHHFNLNTTNDPNLARQQGHDWEFPKTKLGLCWLLLKDLCGGGAIEHAKLLTVSSSRPSIYRMIYHSASVIIIIYAGLGWWFMGLWVLPAMSILPVILRIRAINDHYGIDNRDDYTMSRNTISGWWDGFLLFPHNIGYHLDHHLYPGVPFYNIPRLHRWLLTTSAEYEEHAHQTQTAIGLLDELSHVT